MRLRLSIGAIGLVFLSYGAWRILGNSDRTNPRGLARWLIGAVIIHDGILVPATMVVGFLLTHLVSSRARRYVQGALITSGLVAVIAIPLIDRRGSQPAVKGLELQNYGLHLAVLIALIVGVTAAAYVVRVVLDRRSTDSETNVRSPSLHESSQDKPAAQA